MRGWLIGLLGFTGLVVAQEEKKPFEVNTVLSSAVAKLGPPKAYDGIVSWRPAISANSEEVQAHVHQGMALVHAGWDFEAYRHFCEAAKKDPDCLMAFWGIAFSLIQPNAEVNEERTAALDRIFDLVEEGVGTELEKANVRTLAQLFSDEPELAPDIYQATARKFPNDLQLALMAAFLKKDGYDFLLGEGMGQREAVAEMAKIRQAHPDQKMADLFWVMVQESHTDGPGHLRKEVVPVMRELAQSAPNFAPYQHMLGHFEARAGNLQKARNAFHKASEFYRQHMKEQSVSVADCPNWVRAQLYEATICYSLGEFDDALEIANRLAATNIPSDRQESPGAAALLWEGKILAARLYLGRGKNGDFKKGLDSLPDKKVGEQFAQTNAAVLAWEGWRNILAARNAIQSQVMDRADVYLLGADGSNELLAAVGPDMMSRSSRTYWTRARQGLTTSWEEAQGAYSRLLEGSARERAGFWYEMARNRQSPPSGFLPPILLKPLDLSIAEWNASEGKNEEADKHFKAAMERRPNDVEVLNSYIQWLEKMNQKKSAQELRKHVEMVTSDSSKSES